MYLELQKRIFSSLILIPIVFAFIIVGNIYFNVLIFICFLISLYEWHRLTFKKKYYLIGIVYLIISFSSVYYFRLNNGFLAFLFVILVCIFTDIGGYLFGRIFKGPKLTKISPNKTYTGLFGGFFMPVISFFILRQIENSYLSQLNLFNIIDDAFLNYFLILLISTISQLGDISISYFKRIAKVKDTGKIIPGHGGLLDRIDGMLLAFPTAFLIFKIL